MLIEILAAAVMLQTGAAEPETVPPLVTIAEIHQDPWAWDGRRVRVIVRVDQCGYLDCHICDEPGEGEPWPVWSQNPSCAGVGFVGYSGGDEVARFNTLLIEAEYDASCTGIENPETGERYVCTDRATQFLDSAILEIIEYRQATEFEADRPPNLVEPDGELAEALREAYASVSLPEQRTRYNDGPLETIFWITNRYDPQVRVEFGFEAGVCLCNEDDCDGGWPFRREHLLRAERNPYVCFSAVQREDGSWVFPLQ